MSSVFKRLRWMLTGLALGAGGSVWARKKAKELAGRYSPAGRARGLPGDVAAAIREGRAAMRQREAELKDRHRGTI